MRRNLLDTSALAALLHAGLATVGLMTPWLNRYEAATSILAYGEVVNEYGERFYRGGKRRKS